MHRIIAWFVDNPVAANLLMAIFIAGTWGRIFGASAINVASMFTIAPPTLPTNSVAFSRKIRLGAFFH